MQRRANSRGIHSLHVLSCQTKLQVIHIGATMAEDNLERVATGGTAKQRWLHREQANGAERYCNRESQGAAKPKWVADAEWYGAMWVLLDNGSHQCKVCGQSRSARSASNLIRHMKTTTKCREHYESVCAGIAEKRAETKARAAAMFKMPAQPLGEARQDAITDAVVQLVVKCNLPMNVCSGRAFHEFMHLATPGWRPAGRKALRDGIIEKSAQQHAEAKENVSAFGPTTVALDGWSTRSQASILACTALDHKTGNTELLAFDRIFGSVSGQVIAEWLRTVLEDFALVDKIARVITDSAACMLKGMRVMEYASDTGLESEWRKKERGEGPADLDAGGFEPEGDLGMVEWEGLTRLFRPNLTLQTGQSA
eukprot:GEMP01010919.1.p1 GENE.GEMP01010919.1~~GEMP01010919.1.p1  ORF type:complete len:368 (-),score=82.80 GEMP01010919.1:204-1307(-)